MDENQVEVWARALATRWRGNDESWQLFEPYVRDVLGIIDLPGQLASARQAATVAAAETAARHLLAQPRATPSGIRAAVLGIGAAPPAQIVRLAEAAE